MGLGSPLTQIFNFIEAAATGAGDGMQLALNIVAMLLAFIASIAPLAPHCKKDIASLGLKAVLGGSLAMLMTATLAGILLG